MNIDNHDIYDIYDIYDFDDAELVSIQQQGTSIVIKTEDGHELIPQEFRSGSFKITGVTNTLVDNQPADKIEQEHELEHDGAYIRYLKFTKHYLEMCVEWNIFDTMNAFTKSYKITADHIEWIPDEIRENEKQDD